MGDFTGLTEYELKLVKGNKLWTFLNSIGAIDDPESEVTWVELRIEYEGSWDKDTTWFFVFQKFNVYAIGNFGLLSNPESNEFMRIFGKMFDAHDPDIVNAYKDIQRYVDDDANVQGPDE